ncbi:hypothetical protein GCK32_001186 [Trichostrongylus colubriformis]|uniref:Uncharacterized protein n=1 Tax=Trichostrongylus colubriformis TaxID=6319 RepID=A0AAN8FGY2_TRICO
MTSRMKRPRVYYVFITLIVSVSLLIHYVQKTFHVEKPEVILSERKFINLTVAKYGDDRILEELCFEGGCYLIKDSLIGPIIQFPSERKLIEKETNQVRASAVLSLPEKLVPSATDSRYWLVKRDMFAEGTLDFAIMGAALLSGCLPLNTSAPVDVLIVGLGSGTIANFIEYHYRRSNISILEKHKTLAYFLIQYFQIQPSPRLQVHLGDELEQMYTFSDEYEAKFHVVFYNMCPLLAHHTCPDEKTLPDQAIRSIVELVDEQGVFIANLITNDVDALSTYEKQKYRFDQYFNECILIKPSKVYNQVLSCTQGYHDFKLMKAVKDFIRKQEDE